jgi:hypothetical protein
MLLDAGDDSSSAWLYTRAHPLHVTGARGLRVGQGLLRSGLRIQRLRSKRAADHYCQHHGHSAADEHLC